MSYGIFSADGRRERHTPELAPTFANEALAWEAVMHFLRERGLPVSASVWQVKPVADVRRVPRFEPEPQAQPQFPPLQPDGTINPKDAAALKRVPMHLLPQVGVIYGAMACKDGADKYGPYNWRERAISLTQYIGAMQRHLAAVLDGEDDASDSKLPHLAHVVATASILLDAQAAGALLDDRPKRSGNAGVLISKLNERLGSK